MAIPREIFHQEEKRNDVEVSPETKAARRVLLDMLEVFMRICEKYDLRFFMVGGSMLGTVRHQGFIPWDDDIDVGMPRKDYNKLKKLLPGELPDNLVVQLMGFDDGDSYWPFIKIRNSNTAAIDSAHTNRHMRHNMGLFVDVIPIDGIPQGKLFQMLYNRINKEFRMFRCWPTLDLDNRPLNRVRKVFYRLFGRSLLFSLYEKYLTMCSAICKRKAAEAIAYVGVRDSLIWDVSWFKDVIWRDFEHLKVPLPKEFEKCLARHYGTNWRTPIMGTALHSPLVISTTKGWKQVLVEKYGYTYAELDRIR